MSSLGLLIFDMDGTLVDSMEQHAIAFGQILDEEYDIPPTISKEVYLSTAGKPLDQQFALVLDAHVEPRATNLHYLIERFWVLIQESEPKLFPDVLEAIEHLWRAGYMLAVTSGSASSVVAAKMANAGIGQYFRLMLGTDYAMPGMTKGEEHFKIFRNSLHLDPTEFRRNSALVGDGEHDMLIAKEAGIMAIGRATDSSIDILRKAGADFVIHTLDQLVSILRSPNHGSVQFMPISTIKGR